MLRIMCGGGGSLDPPPEKVDKYELL